MNQVHLEYCASPEWRQIVEELILPEALRGIDLGPDLVEIGPGPGFTTNVLMARTDRLTAVELDPDLAASLAERLTGTNVDVVTGDATALNFSDGSFSGAASFHMLHHIPTEADQNRVLSELSRVLRSGGVFVGADGVYSEESKAFHEDDIYNPIDPKRLEQRLSDSGFADIEVRTYERGWVANAKAG